MFVSNCGASQVALPAIRGRPLRLPPSSGPRIARHEVRSFSGFTVPLGEEPEDFNELALLYNVFHSTANFPKRIRIAPNAGCSTCAPRSLR